MRTEWIFLPLVIGFIIVSAVIGDLKYPNSTKEMCVFVGKGLAIQSFKEKAKILYVHSGKLEDDLALQCPTHGSVVVNDDMLFPVKSGLPIELTQKTYHWLPTQYRLSVPVEAAPKDIESAS